MLKVLDSKLKSILLRVNLIIVNLPIRDLKEKLKISPMEKEDHKMLLENVKLLFLEMVIREMLLWLNRLDCSVILLINVLLVKEEVLPILVEIMDHLVVIMVLSFGTGSFGGNNGSFGGNNGAGSFGGANFGGANGTNAGSNGANFNAGSNGANFNGQNGTNFNGSNGINFNGQNSSFGQNPSGSVSFGQVSNYQTGFGQGFNNTGTNLLKLGDKK
jgi:hypothetical protein